MENLNKQATYKNFYKFGTVLLLIIVFIFYWFAFRPSTIKKECATIQPKKASTAWIAETRTYIEDNCIVNKADDCWIKEPLLKEYTQERASTDIEYKQCLRANGL